LVLITILFYTVILIVLFLYSFHPYLLLYYYFKFRNHTRVIKDKKIADFPMVTVQLPIYNEKYVINRLVKSVAALEYPRDKMEIQILDDSNDETITITANLVKQYQAKGYDIKHIRRGSRDGFKAGALQYGLERSRGDYLAIFDADFIPPADFLIKLLPEFDGPQVGGVQARWGHLNPDDSFLTRSQAIGLDNHFIIEQELRSRAEFFINFNGTCGIWSKKAIQDAGGWHGDTLAEDLDLSYRVQLQGWQIRFRGDYNVPGELPDTADSFRIQQNRWAKGTIQVARKLLPKVLKSNMRPLAKYEAFVHMTCHLNFIAMLGLAIFSLPVVYCKVEGIVPNSYYLFASFFTIGVFGYPLLYALSQKKLYPDYLKRLPYILGVISFSMGLSVSNSKALLEAFLKRQNNFTRTPKTGGAHQAYRSESKSLVPVIEVLLGLYMLVALIYVVINNQIVLIPFLSFYTLGFLNLGFSSIRDEILTYRPQEALCSRENS
jgi:cellulose synthase/poly-beta-1,6-N-acetylglucosamine synthase-like glycosyltransferase